MDQQHANTSSMWVRVYSVDGFELSLTLAVNSAADAAAQLEAVRAAGFLPRKPEVVDGESEVIETVVRRQTENGVPIIDYYPAWSRNDTYGTFKYGHKYLDKAEDVAQFEAQSGLKLADMPLYDGQSAITRKPGKATRFEVRVNHTFSLKKIKVGQYDDGKPKYEYDYATPMKVTARRIDSVEVAKAFVTEVGQRFGVTDAKNILKCLEITTFSEWRGTYDEAMAQVATVVKANQS